MPVRTEEGRELTATLLPARALTDQTRSLAPVAVPPLVRITCGSIELGCLRLLDQRASPLPETSPWNDQCPTTPGLLDRSSSCIARRSWESPRWTLREQVRVGPQLPYRNCRTDCPVLLALSRFRHFPLSWQSALHLSIALLVHHRSHAGYSKLLSRRLNRTITLQSQATLDVVHSRTEPPGTGNNADCGDRPRTFAFWIHRELSTFQVTSAFLHSPRSPSNEKTPPASGSSASVSRSPVEDATEEPTRPGTAPAPAVLCIPKRDHTGKRDMVDILNAVLPRTPLGDS